MIDLMLCPKCGGINNQSINYCRECSRNLHEGKWWKTLSLRFILWVGLFELTLFSFRLIEVNINLYFDFKSVPKPSKPIEVKYEWYGPDINYGDGKATVILYMLTDEYKWELGWYDQLNKNYEKVPLSNEMIGLINGSRKVICVGTSSGEMKQGVSFQEGRIIEEQRAGKRAETIAKWVRERLHDPVTVLKLNAGHWIRSSDMTNTDHQRRVIIILVLRIIGIWDKDKALRKAFEDAAREEPIYKIILKEYSLTQGNRFVWVE
ncbi:MAG: hypothetical protein L0226_11165 [Acidobacteria bacterium]|nr:hypothetical protein [Acidobacteriota bacterium]